jgi:hypothetical protein
MARAALKGWIRFSVWVRVEVRVRGGGLCLGQGEGRSQG